MKNIILVDYIFASKENQRHLGLINLNNILNKNGYYSKIMRFNREFFDDDIISSKDITKMANHILDQDPNPDGIGLSTLCISFHITLALAKKIKEISPKSIIFLGGPHSTLTFEYILSHFKYIDFIVIGESENTILDILSNYKNFSNNISGVSYLNSEGIYHEKSKHLVDFKDIILFDDNYVYNNRISLEGGRGCPFNCSFCCTKIFWNKTFRLKPVEILVEEMEYYYNKHNIIKFDIEHDLFIYSKPKFIEFCELLINKGLNTKLSWTCSSRIDILTEEIILKMKEAGCSEIFLGIESISVDIQKKIHKNLNIDKIFHNLELLYKNNISTCISLIFGFPFETLEEFEKTIQFADFCSQQYNSRVSVGKLRYYPGSELTAEYFNQLVFDQIFYRNSIFQDHMIEQEILQHKEIFSEFYTFHTAVTDKFYYYDIYHNFIIALLKQFFQNTYNMLCTKYGGYHNEYNKFADYFEDFEFLKRSFNSSSNFTILQKYYLLIKKILHNHYGNILNIFLDESKKYNFE